MGNQDFWSKVGGGEPKGWLEGQLLTKKNVSKRAVLCVSEIQWKKPLNRVPSNRFS